MQQTKIMAIAVGLVAVLYGTGLLWMMINAVLVIGFALLGIYCGVACALNTNKKYFPSTKPLPVRPTTTLFQKMSVSFC